MASFLNQFARPVYTGQAPQPQYMGFTPEARAAATAAQVLDAYNTSAPIRALADLVARPIATAYWTLWEKLTSEGRGMRDRMLQRSGFEQRKTELSVLKAGKRLRQIEQHPFLDLISDPSPDLTAFQFWALFQIATDLTGNAFALISRTAGVPTALHFIPPHCIVALPTQQSPFFQIRYEQFNGAFRQEDVLWHKTPNPMRPLGYGSGLGVALWDETLALEATQEAIRAAMSRANTPLQVWAVQEEGQSDPRNKQSAVQTLTTQLEQYHTRPNDLGRPLVAGGKLTVANTAPNFVQLQVSELNSKLVAVIRECWGVAPEMLGQMGAGGDRGKAEQARYVFADQVTAPRLEALRQFLQADLLPLFDPSGTLICHYVDPRPADAERFAQFALSNVGGPAFELNEIRIAAGCAPLERLNGVMSLPPPGSKPLADSGTSGPEQ